MNCELEDVQAGFRKCRGTRDQIANIYCQQYMSHELPVVQVDLEKTETRGQTHICWVIKKAREFQKNICFCFIDSTKAFDCVDHNKLENSERDGNTRPPDLLLEKSVCRSGNNS